MRSLKMDIVFNIAEQVLLLWMHFKMHFIFSVSESTAYTVLAI